MDNRIIVQRILPSGRPAWVRPFHISLEGLESATICRDEEDYDAMVKHIFTCARRNDVLVVIYAVVSNHSHEVVLAAGKEEAEKFANDLKKVHSMWIRRKYGEYGILRRVGADISPIETITHARNALAYVPRNAMDNGAKNIAGYKWTGYRAMFCEGKAPEGLIPVSSLTTRASEKLLHTGDDVSRMSWLLNVRGEIEPASACDWRYLEMIFNHDPSFFMRKIGDVNVTQMKYDLKAAGKYKMTDAEFLKTAEEYAMAWYKEHLFEMSHDTKARFLQYLGKKVRLTIPQVARCMQMDRDVVSVLLERKRKE